MYKYLNFFLLQITTSIKESVYFFLGVKSAITALESTVNFNDLPPSLISVAVDQQRLGNMTSGFLNTKFSDAPSIFSYQRENALASLSDLNADFSYDTLPNSKLFSADSHDSGNFDVSNVYSTL